MRGGLGSPLLVWGDMAPYLGRGTTARTYQRLIVPEIIG